jgi:hypothetical protein
MIDFLTENKNLLKEILRYLLLAIMIRLILCLFVHNQLNIDDYEKVMSTLLSTLGVTIAIIVSFLFTKLFSERNERIERKRLIDIKSKQVTAFRKICFFIRNSHKFWKPFGNLKSKFDTKYKDLTLSSYDSEKIDFETFKKFLTEVNNGEIGGQAYTGLRDIEGQEQSKAFYNSQLRKNYSLTEIDSINNASNRVWYFFDRYKPEIIDINTIDYLSLKIIKENIKIIYPKYDLTHLKKDKIIEMFSDFHENITKELYYLTQKNSKYFGKSISHLLFDLFIFVLIMISGIFILSFDFSSTKKIFCILCSISTFIVFALDLLFNVITSIRQELTIDDFYEL